MKWNFAESTWHCPKAENNLEVGGTFNYRMESKKDDFGFDFKGIFDEIRPSKLLKFHLDDGRKVVVDFNNIDEKTTEVTETFEPENDNLIDMQRDGWYSILNNFHKYVENN
ncbi:SRPBCC domain-containing protein [Halpernia sp. GG3]